MARQDRTSLEARLLGQLREELHRRLAPYRQTALLAALIAAFLVRPSIGDNRAGLILFNSAMLLLLLLSLYNIDVDELVGQREVLLVQRRRRNAIAWMLAIPAIAQRFMLIFTPNHSIYLAGSIMWLLLFAFITWNELRAVLRQRVVTREVISMSISTYLLFRKRSPGAEAEGVRLKFVKNDVE